MGQECPRALGEEWGLAGRVRCWNSGPVTQLSLSLGLFVRQMRLMTATIGGGGWEGGNRMNDSLPSHGGK